MALSKKIVTNHGLILDNAYIKITKQAGDKSNINLIASVFVDKVSSDNGMESLEQYIYNFKPTLDINFIKQGYEYLKSLEEFTDAIDC